MRSISKTLAPPPKFNIDIQPEFVHVELNTSAESPRRRFYAGAFFLIFVIVVEGVMLFARDKDGGPGAVRWLLQLHISRVAALLVSFFFIVWNAVLIFLMRRSLLGFYPSDEILRCDRSTLTLSRVRWFDTSNSKLITQTFSVSEIAQVRYASVANDRYRSIYGLRFSVNGKKITALPGLGSHQANNILMALHDLGVDLNKAAKFKQR